MSNGVHFSLTRFSSSKTVTWAKSFGSPVVSTPRGVTTRVMLPTSSYS
jgi:hypothetical protein